LIPASAYGACSCLTASVRLRPRRKIDSAHSGRYCRKFPASPSMMRRRLVGVTKNEGSFVATRTLVKPNLAEFVLLVGRANGACRRCGRGDTLASGCIPAS
jgi:hypothetical protein